MTTGPRRHVQRFNSPRGWRLLGTVALWAAAAFAYGWGTSWEYAAGLNARLPLAVFGAALWGIPMVIFWIAYQKEIVVGENWLELRTWWGVLFRRGPRQRWVAERGHLIVRPVSGRFAVQASAGAGEDGARGYPYGLGGFRDWKRFVVAVQPAGFEVEDKRGVWESVHPWLHWGSRLLTGGMFAALVVGMLVFVWPLPSGGSQRPPVGLLFGLLGVAFVLGLSAWSLTRVSRD